jgi:beta-lactamase class A
MIIYSDNLAMNVMFQKFPNISPEGVFKDLNIELTSDESTGEAEVNVYLYASFFRILYNASYLRPEFSNWALQLMTNTAFHDGLVAGVPKDVVVAHKFGERENIEGRQLHDCGIIYHPRSPYLLCIMTRGKEFNELAQVIQKLSSFVYKKVDENR